MYISTRSYAWLTWLQVAVQPVVYPITTDECTIGRSPLCQIVIQHNTVSRLHACIRREGVRYVLQDTGSTNGTFVNGRRIQEPYPLVDHDLIGLAGEAVLLRFGQAGLAMMPGV